MNRFHVLDKMRIGILIISLLLIPVVSKAALFNVTIGTDIYGTYDDNILLMSDEQKAESDIDPDDRILQIKPFISILHEGKRSFIKVRYEYFKEWYDIDHPLERTDKSYSNADLSASWDVTDRITLALYDTYKDSLYGTELAEIPDVREDYTTNSLQPRIQYNFDDKFKVSLALEYAFMDYDFNAIHYTEGLSGYDDWDHWGGILKGFVKLLTNTDIVFGGELWTRDYDNQCPDCDSDSNGYNLHAGIRQMFGDQITLTGWLNYDSRTFDYIVPGKDDDTLENWGGYLEFKDQFSGITSLTLTAFSRFVASERVSSAFYRDTGAEGIFTAHFGKYIESAVNFRYSSMDYKHVSEPWTDDYIKAGVMVGYKAVDWMSIRLRYQYADRDSDIDYYDFTDNLVSIYFHFHFDLFK